MFYIGMLVYPFSWVPAGTPLKTQRSAQSRKHGSLPSSSGGKKGRVLTNHTALIDRTHLVDSLISLGIDIRMIFAPEHGFRGNEDAGTRIDHHTDADTGIPVVSVYGSAYIPQDSLMQQLDIAIFDIQTLG